MRIDRTTIRRHSRVEELETRRLLSVTFGQNLVINGGAEQYSGTADGYNLITPAHWIANGDATVVRYDRDYGSSINITRPGNGGSVFFSGGPDQESTDFVQTIDLSSIATQIDGGHVNFLLGALLGGYSTSTDNAQVFVNFENSSNTVIAQRGTGSVSASDRDYTTELIGRLTTGSVPVTTRFAEVDIHFKRDSLLGYNNAFADNVSFQVVTNTPSTAGVTPVFARSTLPATVIGSQPIHGAVVFSMTNTSSSINRGVDTITLFASADGAVDASSIPLATFHRLISLDASASKLLGFSLHSLPVPAGTYTILAQTIDRYLTVVNAATGPTVTVVAPTIVLSSTVAQPLPVSVPPGRVINLVVSVENTGNVKSSGLARINISLSSNTNPTPALLTTRYARVTFKPTGVPVKLRFRVRIPATQAAGTYTPVVTITQGTSSTTAVSDGVFVVG